MPCLVFKILLSSFLNIMCRNFDSRYVALFGKSAGRRELIVVIGENSSVILRLKSRILGDSMVIEENDSTKAYK